MINTSTYCMKWHWVRNNSWTIQGLDIILDIGILNVIIVLITEIIVIIFGCTIGVAPRWLSWPLPIPQCHHWDGQGRSKYSLNCTFELGGLLPTADEYHGGNDKDEYVVTSHDDQSDGDAVIDVREGLVRKIHVQELHDGSPSVLDVID